jgi:hypothetical protein
MSLLMEDGMQDDSLWDNSEHHQKVKVQLKVRWMNFLIK